MYRNILKIANSYRYITQENLLLSFKRTIHTAPFCVYDKIVQDLIDWKLIHRINERWYVVLENKHIEKELKNLKLHVFPI